MLTNVTLTTEQLGLISFAASDAASNIRQSLQEGTNMYDMPKETLRKNMATLHSIAQLFKALEHNAWVHDMEEKDKANNGRNNK